MKLGIFASHNGSTMQAIVDACHDGRINASVQVVISNNKGSPVLLRTETAGIPHFLVSSLTHPNDDHRDASILGVLQESDVNLVILAGYMKKISPRTLEHYRGRIINTHPALLPKFGGKGMYGMFVHEAVLAAGDRVSGATIHIVDEDYDHGPILAQSRVPVYPTDTPHSLGDRVAESEKDLYVETIRRIIDGTLRV